MLCNHYVEVIWSKALTQALNSLKLDWRPCTMITLPKKFVILRERFYIWQRFLIQLHFKSESKSESELELLWRRRNCEIVEICHLAVARSTTWTLNCIMAIYDIVFSHSGAGNTGYEWSLKALLQEIISEVQTF